MKRKRKHKGILKVAIAKQRDYHANTQQQKKNIPLCVRRDNTSLRFFIMLLSVSMPAGVWIRLIAKRKITISMMKRTPAGASNPAMSGRVAGKQLWV